MGPCASPCPSGAQDAATCGQSSAPSDHRQTGLRLVDRETMPEDLNPLGHQHLASCARFCGIVPRPRNRASDQARDHLVRRARTWVSGACRQWLHCIWRRRGDGLAAGAVIAVTKNVLGRALMPAPRAEAAYCTASPCKARSRPSRSVSSLTRSPTKILTTVRITKLAMAQ